MPLVEGEILTSLNAHKLTTFELRQELVKRDALDLPEKEINHRNMMRRLVEELVRQDNVKVAEHTAVLEKERLDDLAVRKAERERKKQEAIERSKARQANKDYFQSKKEASEKGEQLLKKAKEDPSIEVVQVGEEDDDEDDDDDDDPFRSYKPKKKGLGPKIFVK